MITGKDRAGRGTAAAASYALLLLVALSIAGLARGQESPARPNIVFILSDDHNHAALGIAGHKLLKTPNLDSVAREGVWFRHAVVATPLCAPSRTAFLTGLYGHTSGFRANNAPWPEKFPPSFLSVAHAAGYRTAFFGKKHIYNTDDSLPGVDRWVSFVNQGRFVDPDVNIDGERRRLTGANGDLLTDFAADFIRENRARPFAMVVAYKEAHSQQTAPPRFDPLFENDTITLPATFNEDKSTKPAFFRATMNIPNSGFAEPGQANQPPAGMTREQLAIKKIKNYYRCIAALDDYVGRIRKALADSGQLDNTILVFAGDNGYFLGDHGRFEKMTPHEESVRIPFLMRYPPAIRRGTVSDEFVLNVDLAPTLYDLAGLKGPEKLEPGYVSTPPPPPPAAPNPDANPIPTWRALRTHTHKYAVYLNGDMSELYDLKADPKETRNLIRDPAQQRRIAEMHNRLLQLADEGKDPLRPMLPATPQK